MGETAQQPAALSTRQPIPGVASLRVNPERIERMWQMTAQQRVEAAQQGQFTLGEMLRWASRPAERGRPWSTASGSSSPRCPPTPPPRTRTAILPQGEPRATRRPSPPAADPDTSEEEGPADARPDRRDRPAARAPSAPTSSRSTAMTRRSRSEATRLALKLAELPDALLLGDLGGPFLTIAPLRRAARRWPGHRLTSLPVLVIGADHDPDAIPYYDAGADVALAGDSSPLLLAAALDALARRTAAPAARGCWRDRSPSTATPAPPASRISRSSSPASSSTSSKRSPASPARPSAPPSSPATSEATTPPPPAPAARSTPPRTACVRSSEHAGAEPIMHSIPASARDSRADRRRRANCHATVTACGNSAPGLGGRCPMRRSAVRDIAAMGALQPILYRGRLAALVAAGQGSSPTAFPAPGPATARRCACTRSRSPTAGSPARQRGAGARVRARGQRGAQLTFRLQAHSV